MKKIGLGIALILFGILLAVFAIAVNFPPFILAALGIGLMGLLFAVSGYRDKDE